jgi:hypothetical protein
VVAIRSCPAALALVAVIIVWGAVPVSASAGPITEGYVVGATIMPAASPDPSAIQIFGQLNPISPSAWSSGPVLIGSFYVTPPDSNLVSLGDGSYILPSSPFTLDITPTQLVAGTGPEYDGAVIQGVISGVVRRAGQGESSLVATFQSVTPNDVASWNPPAPNYQVDPSLANPFPIAQLVLPQSVPLNPDGWTEIYATIVPEPGGLLLFATIAIVAAARSRHRGGGQAARAREADRTSLAPIVLSWHRLIRPFRPFKRGGPAGRGAGVGPATPRSTTRASLGWPPVTPINHPRQRHAHVRRWHRVERRATLNFIVGVSPH